jgi:hypothetical protein
MTKSLLTATALAAVLGFGANVALAQQNAPVEAPAIQKSAPAQSGKATSDTVRQKSHDASAKTHKAKRDAAMTKKNHSTKSHTKTPTDQKAATPDKSKTPGVGG